MTRSPGAPAFDVLRSMFHARCGTPTENVERRTPNVECRTSNVRSKPATSDAPVQFLREVVKIVRLGRAEQCDRRPALAHFDEAAGRDRKARLPVERQVHTVLALEA